MPMVRRARIAVGVSVVAALGVVGLAILPLGSRAAAYTPMTAPVLSMRALTQPISDGTPNAPQIRLGQYLVRVGDCASCHTRDGGSFLAGGRALNTPFGSIYSANL